MCLYMFQLSSISESNDHISVIVTIGTYRKVDKLGHVKYKYCYKFPTSYCMQYIHTGVT